MTIPVDYLVVAGGGGGGNAIGGEGGGSGGGAGGVLSGTGYAAATGTALTVTVGGGGGAQANGANSVFASFTAIGGGKGGGSGAVGSGGSGGGQLCYLDSGPGSGTAGQGYAGGSGAGSGAAGCAGGGGGAGAVGGTATTAVAGSGGVGVSNSISGAAVTYGGGGGGSCYSGGTGGTGGTGGGGAGRAGGGGVGGNGTDNTGGGAGGGGGTASSGGTGGSGIVILKYEDSYAEATATTGSPSYSVGGGFRTYTWTTTGSWSITLPASSAVFNETISEIVSLLYSATPPNYDEVHNADIVAVSALVGVATFQNHFGMSVAFDFTPGNNAQYAGTISESVALGFSESDSLSGAGSVYNDTHSASIYSGFSFFEYDDATRLLLKFDEVNGSTTPLDTSSYGWLRTVTTGTGAVSSAQGLFGTNSIALGNPTGAKDLAAFVNVSGVNDLFQYDGSVNKQFDIWFRPINGSSHTMFSVRLNNGDRLILYYSGGTTYVFYSDTTNTVGIYASCSFAGTIAANTWAHYRVALNGDTLRVGKDGVDKASVTLAQNVWRGRATAGTPPVPSEVRLGRYPSDYDANSGYDFLVAQGYADCFVVTEGVGVWTGGTYDVPLHEPADTWYRESDNVIGLYVGDAFDVGVGFSMAAPSHVLSAVITANTSVGFSIVGTGGASGFDEAVSFNVGVGFRVASQGQFVGALNTSVSMGYAPIAWRAYADDHMAAVTTAFSTADSRRTSDPLNSPITMGFSLLDAPTYNEPMYSGIIVGASAATTQDHRNSILETVKLYDLCQTDEFPSDLLFVFSSPKTLFVKGD